MGVQKWYNLVDVKRVILWKSRCRNNNKNQLLTKNCNDNKSQIKLNINKGWYEKDGMYLGTDKCSCVQKQAVYKLITASQAKKRISGYSFGKSKTGFYDEQSETVLYLRSWDGGPAQRPPWCCGPFSWIWWRGKWYEVMWPNLPYGWRKRVSLRHFYHIKWRHNPEDTNLLMGMGQGDMTDLPWNEITREVISFNVSEYTDICKGKAVPLQAWSDPECFRKLRFPDYMTVAQNGGKVVSLK